MNSEPKYDDLLIEIKRLKTENKRLKKDIKIQFEAMERFKALMNNMQIGVLIEDNERVVTEVNKKFCKLFGIEKKDKIIGENSENVAKSISKYFKDQKKFLSTIDNTIKNEKLSFNQELNLSDGSFFETDYVPIFYEKGFLGNIWLYRDVTRFKKNELEIRNQKQRLDDIIEATNVGTWEWNIQSGEMIFNERWAEIIGYKLLELEPLTIETRNKFYHPVDLKNSSEKIKKHFDGEIDFYEQEFRMKHKNGEWVWVLDRGKVTKRDKNGKPLWMYGTHQEITDRKIAEIELKESKELFTAFMDNLPAIVFIKDSDFKTRFVNKYLIENLGHKESWIGKTLIDIFGNSDTYKAMLKYDKKVLDEGIHVIEEDLQTVDGTIQNFETRKFRIDRENKTPLIGGIALNITERKKTEKALKESEEKYRLLTDLSGDMILMYRNFEKIYVNPTVEKILGFSQKEFMEIPTLELIHKDDTDLFIKETEYEDKKIDKNIVFDSRIRHKAGHFVWLSIQVIIHKIDDTNTISVFNIRDITNRKEIELENKKFSTTISQSPVAIVITDTNGIITYTNPHFTEFTGYKFEEVEGKTTQIFKSGHHTNDFYKNLWDTIKSGQVWKGEFLNKHKNGSLFWEEAIISPIYNNQNEIINFVAIKQDVTEKKTTQIILEKQRKRIETILNTTLTGISIIEFNGTIIYTNPASEYILGYSQDEIRDSHINKIVHPDDWERTYNIFNALEKQETVFSDNEIRLIHKISKEIIWIHLNVTKYPKLEERDNERILIVFQDITKQKHIEADLKEALETKNKFFSIIAHDLRTPFSAILGFSDILQSKYKEFDEQRRKKLIETIYNSGKSALDLLENLLEWSRSQTGKITFSPDYHILENILDDSVLQMTVVADKKNISLSYNLKDNYLVYADKSMLNTILRNLISNAIKFTKKKGKIEICASDKDNFVIVEVKDNGIGIKKNILKEIFTVSKKTTTLGTENEKGTGLGLILCKEFVEKNGGQIWIESETNVGSSFYFSLKKNNI